MDILWGVEEKCRRNSQREGASTHTKLLHPHICLLHTHTHTHQKKKKNISQALICQREQSLRDNLIVFSGSAVFDVSGMVASEQTIILLIRLVFSNFPCLRYSSESPRPDALLHLTWQPKWEEQSLLTLQLNTVQYNIIYQNGLTRPLEKKNKKNTLATRCEWSAVVYIPFFLPFLFLFKAATSVKCNARLAKFQTDAVLKSGSICLARVFSQFDFGVFHHPRLLLL